MSDSKPTVPPAVQAFEMRDPNAPGFWDERFERGFTPWDQAGVPSAFVQLRSLPLTPSGKVDRRALPAPAMDAYAQRRYEAPEGEIETTLSTLWAELLNVRQVGRHDNFFELGGNSLLAIRLAARMRERGLYTETVALFTSSDLAELAERVDTNSREVAVPPNLIPAIFEEMRF